MRPPSRRERIATTLADLRCRARWKALDEILAGVDDGGTTAGEAIYACWSPKSPVSNSC